MGASHVAPLPVRSASSAAEGPQGVELVDGTRRCFENGVLHRADGPAVEREGKREWVVRGSAAP